MRDYLVEKRNELGLSQQDVAESLGISRQYYGAIEQGIRQKTLEITLVSGLSKILGISIMSIIEAENKIKEESTANVSSDKIIKTESAMFETITELEEEPTHELEVTTEQLA